MGVHCVAFLKKTRTLNVNYIFLQFLGAFRKYCIFIKRLGSGEIKLFRVFFSVFFLKNKRPEFMAGFLVCLFSFYDLAISIISINPGVVRVEWRERKTTSASLSFLDKFLNLSLIITFLAVYNSAFCKLPWKFWKGEMPVFEIRNWLQTCMLHTSWARFAHGT